MNSIVTCCTWLVGQSFVNQKLNTLTGDYFFEVCFPDGTRLDHKSKKIAFRWAKKY